MRQPRALQLTWPMGPLVTSTIAEKHGNGNGSGPALFQVASRSRACLFLRHVAAHHFEQLFVEDNNSERSGELNSGRRTSVRAMTDWLLSTPSATSELLVALPQNCRPACGAATWKTQSASHVDICSSPESDRIVAGRRLPSLAPAKRPAAVGNIDIGQTADFCRCGNSLSPNTNTILGRLSLGPEQPGSVGPSQQTHQVKARA